ncbi:uncharacterized protein LOC131148950 [Malania oleifera]|uniref:uncharacterized protein LOC131148950 n=1 Tax=Malania oleifera TaxID=397392 RepID=UPI0025AE55B9|nr:uncharacterized protein LOC131148950 [Malania oleifera]XP_057954912.1 uncharacterized protein LOC131148950 [Malania oleifera]XP_057954913.1 uncharacterized protein LOC131148950 [Malania oleifera]
MKNVDDTVRKTSGTDKKQWNKGKAAGDDELVKYMHSLPSFLEKGENVQEKVLNVGVLNWVRLEKWQCDHKQNPYKSSMCSPSSYNTSPFFSTDRSSADSSRGPSCSPAHPKMHRPTLRCHLNAFSEEGYPPSVQYPGGNVQTFQYLNAACRNASKWQQNILCTGQRSLQGHSEINLENCKRKDIDSQFVPEREILLNLENIEVKSCLRGNIKIQDDELTESAEELQELTSNFIDTDSPERPETIVLIPPNDRLQSHSRVSTAPGSPMLAEQRLMEVSRMQFLDSSSSPWSHSTKLYSDIPCSSSLLQEPDCSKDSLLKPPTSTDALDIKFSSDASHLLPLAGKRLVSPNAKKTEEKSTVMALDSTVDKLSEGSDLKVATDLSAKARNRSSACRFGIGMGRTGRNSSSNEVSAMPSLSPTRIIAISVAERDAASASLDNSCSVKQNATNRAMAPLRRLLDPLVKPKAVKYHNVAEPLQKDCTPTKKSSKSFNGRLHSSTGQPVKSAAKLKLDFTGCKTINVSNSFQDRKQKSAVQALLKVAVKNGLPLFTFAVANDGDILAATVRRLSTPGKDDYFWIYTFFAISEIKKKNGSWINQGGKGMHHGYIPNVVGQMKVSDSQLSSLTRPKGMDGFNVREFVLFSVDQGPANEQPLSIQPSDELAAIVIKFPKETARRSNKDEQKNGCDNSVSDTGLKDFSPELNYAENGNSGFFVGSETFFSTTVILPSGVHSLPTKGGPSSLIERWKSGGLCDCGGWDLGCKLRIIGNENQLSTKFSPMGSFSTNNPFDLFDQEEVQEKQPVFSLASLEDGIYSVDFSSALSLLQAFSICIAVLDGRKLLALPQQSSLFEEKMLKQTGFLDNGRMKASSQIQAEVLMQEQRPATLSVNPSLSSTLVHRGLI